MKRQDTVIRDLRNATEGVPYSYLVLRPRSFFQFRQQLLEVVALAQGVDVGIFL